MKRRGELSPTYRRGIRRRPGRRARPRRFAVGQAAKPTAKAKPPRRSLWFLFGAGAGASLVWYLFNRSEVCEVCEGDELGDNPGGRWESSEVQSLLFDRDGWSAREAAEWAEEHGFVGEKVHTTENYHRVRQFPPTGGPCRTVTFEHGSPLHGRILAVVCEA